MRLYLHHLPGLEIVRDNVADPFHANPDGTARLRDATAESGIELCDSLEDADIAGLPAHWAYYRDDRVAEVADLVARAGSAGKRVVIWVNGDDEFDLPWANVVQFQHAVRASRRRAGAVQVYPPFIEDYVELVFGGEETLVDRGDRPIVGFCGQAKPVPLDEVKRVVAKARSRFAHRRGSPRVPEPWPSHVLLRHRCLRALERDPAVATDFVIRDRYRAGVQSLAERRSMAHASQTEFFDNILRTHFTVSVRGGGNFSVRLYETLCLGRVPAHVDSDAVLPWPDHPFWHRTMARTDQSDPAGLGRAVAARFASWDADRWLEVQHEARAFWQDRLSIVGYFRHFREALEP